MRYYPRELNEQHLRVIALVAEGLGNADIGKRLHITEDTVKTHLQGIFKLLGVRNRAHLVNVAWQRGILTGAPLAGPLSEPAPAMPQPKPRPASRARGPLFERHGLIYRAVPR